MKYRKHILAFYGLILVVFSIWFCINYRLIFDPVFFFPPITSIVVWIGVLTMFFLMFDKERVKLLFGENDEARRNILKILGVLFTGFILMITLLWSLSSSELHQNVLYWQSLLLVGLFFYITAAFYCILADLK